MPDNIHVSKNAKIVGKIHPLEIKKEFSLSYCWRVVTVGRRE
jgi:hypothetical protein